ncbi:MAG: hypothetical protein R3336_04065, partial [Phycisphaeraceae bacterium]|nr:hypothetical protein [Phycisphaeraceae bacterium]
RPDQDKSRGISWLVFLTVFWATKGIEVDLLYRLQTWMFGDGRDPATLVVKVLVDQGVYVPIWAIPSTVLAFHLHDCRYRLKHAWQTLGPHWYRRRVVPLMLANLGVWIPAVTLIYCMPAPLQLPTQNLVLCLWSLMVIFICDDGQDPVAG